jgi:hypothetical protein
MPVFGYSNKMVNVEINGRCMNAVEKTRLIIARNILLQERISPFETLRELTSANKIRFLASKNRRVRLQLLSSNRSQETYRQTRIRQFPALRIRIQ